MRASRRLLLSLLLLLGAGGVALLFLWDRQDRRYHVVLVVIDTCRADHTGFGGHVMADGSSPTPTLDRLAARATALRWGLSPVPLTLPSVTSIMSGLYPDAHGVRENDSFRIRPRSDRDYSLLAEDLRAAGWRTAAFVSGQPLERRFGLASGFQIYDQPSRQTRPKFATQFRERAATATTDAALAWLQKPARSPFFLFVHYFDPHAPYAGEGGGSHADPGQRDAAYVSEIRRVDRAIGRLLAALPQDGRKTLIMVVGDHGESLGEHGELTHGQLLYESTLRVPFLLKLPEGQAGPIPDEVPPRLIDVKPTILAVCGCASTGRRPVDGRSLLDPAPPDWFSRAETLYGYYQLRFARIRTFRDRKLKLMESGSLRHLFDWRLDAAEQRDLLPASRTEAHGLKQRLLSSLQSRHSGAAEQLDVPPGASTPYIGVRERGAPIEPSELENEKLLPTERGLDLVAALQEARALIRAREFPRAALLLEGFADRRDAHPALLFWTARAYMRCDELEGLSLATRLDRLDRASGLFARHARLYGSTRALDSNLRIRLRRSLDLARAAGEAAGLERKRLSGLAEAELKAIVREVDARRLTQRLTVIALASAGQAQERLGQPEAALHCFEEALARDPGHPSLQRDVKRLRDQLGGAPR